MTIYPSILEKNVSDLFTQLENVLPHFPHFQIDITDGIFVPSKTVQIEEIARQVSSSKLQVTGKTFEFHLMVKDWEIELPKLEALSVHWNINRILVHAPALNSNFQFPISNFQFGIVLNPEDAVDQYIETILKLPVLQLMTVQPGGQGNPFVPEALSKIKELREKGFAGDIILDGAMNDKNLETVLQQKYLPTAICPGSYFKKDVQERLKRLNEIASSFHSSQ